MSESWRLMDISQELHRRVQLFAADGSGSFDELALAIAHFQAEASPGIRRLQRRPLTTLDDVPAVPSAAFRLTRVACFPPELERVRFLTSGTTAAERGSHAMRRTDTYEQLALNFGRQALLPASADTAPVVVALAPAPSDPPRSSLGYMMSEFMQRLDGQPLDVDETSFDVTAPPRWLLSDQGVDHAGLRRAIRAAEARHTGLLLLGTAFAWVRLLDDLAEDRLVLPAGSVVMQTGGFKGRSREVSMTELRAGLGRALCLPDARVVGEYGMTELTSQLYEATIAESSLGMRHPAAGSGIYFEPPWLRVTPVDPVSLLPVADGDVGLACFVDLGNVDSALKVVTEDLVRRRHGGIELLGRQRGAPSRGCSLAVEALLNG